MSVGIQPISIAMDNIDGDGGLDLISANLQSDSISVFYNERLGFSEATSYPVGAEPESVVVVDLNGDDAVDLATANSESNDISMF